MLQIPFTFATTKPLLYGIISITAVAAGALTASDPRVTIVVALLAAAVLIATIGSSLRILIGWSISSLLVGYFFFGRAFAYLGVAPVFAGEVVLLAALLSMLFVTAARPLSPLFLLLSTFLATALVLTLPGVSNYGLIAVRDAAVWYYASFALVIFWGITLSQVRTALLSLGHLIPGFVIWALITALFASTLANIPIGIPGAPVTIFEIKPGDRGVMLTAVAVYLLVGLPKTLNLKYRFPIHLLWGIWIVASGAVAVGSRGGLLALSAGLGIVFLVSPRKEWARLIAIVAAGIVLLILFDPQFEVAGYRSFSMDQLLTNITSIFSENTENIGAVQQNRSWRLDFWSAIWNDISSSGYFWTGRGFGLNLADEYGFQVLADSALRYPHNVSITILARMGFWGLGMWVLVQSVYVVMLIFSIKKAERREDSFSSGTMLVLLGVWAAALVNASFDVYLEGPQGAVPFWCAFGVGMILISHEASLSQNSTRYTIGESVGQMSKAV